jgi:hypothetical protein
MRLLKFFAGAVLMAGSAHAATIYLCKAYNGGEFWASNHCNQHQALIERIVTVPDGMPFNQQVDLGNQQLRRVQQQNRSTTTHTYTNESKGQSSIEAECAALEARIVSYDAVARQPQTAQRQDWIRQERKKARDQQARLRC